MGSTFSGVRFSRPHPLIADWSSARPGRKFQMLLAWFYCILELEGHAERVLLKAVCSARSEELFADIDK
jgi:hypothetical protein